MKTPKTTAGAETQLNGENRTNSSGYTETLQTKTAQEGGHNVSSQTSHLPKVEQDGME